MKKKKLEQGRSKTGSNAAWVLRLGVGLTTLYIAPNLNDPFNTPKLIIILLLSAWLFGHLFKSYAYYSLQKNSLEYFSLLVLIVFNLSLVFAFLFTDLKIVGLIGDTQRRNGLLSYVALSIIFLYASRTANFYQIRKIFITAIFVGLIVGIYGVLQSFGYDPIPWDNPYNNVIGTLGNPNFASALLAVLCLISFSTLFINSISSIIKLVSLLTCLVSIFAILQSDSRQGLVALFIGLLVLVTFYAYMHSKILGGVAVISSFFIVALGVLGMLQMGPLQSLIYKDSVSVRGYYWRAAFEMFKHNPVTGVGLDSYGWFFKQYRELEYALTYGYSITTSNAHNTILQLFATGGVFVGSTYLVFILIVTYCGILTIRKLSKEQKIIGVTLFATWLAFQSQSFISIDNIGISVWGWLVGGLIVGLCQNNGSDPSSALGSSHIRKKTSRASIDVIQPIVSIFLLSISVVVSAFLYQAERDTYEARSYGTMRDNTGREIVKLKFISLSKNPIVDPYYMFLVNLAFIDSGLDEEGYSGVNLLLKQDPRNLAYLNYIAYLSETKKDIKTAINSRISITKFDPWNLRNMYLLGELYLVTSDLEKARKYFNEIVAIAPQSEEAGLAKTKLANL